MTIMTSSSRTFQVTRIQAQEKTSELEEVVVEQPVSLTVNGELWLTFMCTPIDLETMAVGFLFNEGIINHNSDIENIRLCASGDNIDIWLKKVVNKPQDWQRTSGCSGGITSVRNSSGRPINTNSPLITADQISTLIEQLFVSQRLYEITGGVHTTGLSDGRSIVFVAEDIGRHNTLDKIAGQLLLSDTVLQEKIIITTGRISSEMLQKSSRMGAAVVISRTSPTSLSIEDADQLGITLIGYARRNRIKVYSHPERFSGIP
jgi:FdhD protein